MKKLLLIFFVILGVISCKENRLEVQKEPMFPLQPNSIHLSGYLEDYIQLSIEKWNKGGIPYNEFANFFREGRPQFALGEMWGKSVRSACLFYRYTQDQELKHILDETVKDLLSTQRENGSISCVEIENQPEESELWERKYVMLGLEEYYEWVSPDQAVLDALKKQADNIISLVGHAPKKEIVDIGWSATNVGYEACHIESSTLLEPFMRLYKFTGEQRYLDFATYIVESGGTKNYNVLEMALNNVEPYKMAGHYPKAYEMTSFFEGLVEYYRVTEDPKLKQIVTNYYQNVKTHEMTIVGNGGADQPYHPQVAGEAWGNTAYEQTNPDITRMMETCAGITWMKYGSQMLRLTGDPAIVDEIEKYIYNGLIGSMNPDGSGFSYVNLLNGQKVNGHGWGWKFDDLHVTCCNLNGPMGLAYIPYIALMNSAEGPVVNLYNACTATVKSPKNKDVNVSIVTDFPQSGNVIVNIDPADKESFNLKLRMPEWSKNTIVKVNGVQIEQVKPGTYLDIQREWNKGDKIEILFEMQCHVIDAPKGSNPLSQNFQAVKWGPIVLARDENIDAGYNKPTKIIADENGLVNVQKVQPTLAGTRIEFIVPTVDGDIHMSDFGSIDGWKNDSHICTWLPLK